MNVGVEAVAGMVAVDLNTSYPSTVPFIGFLHTTLTFLSEPSKETSTGDAIPNTDSTAPISELVPAGPGLALPYKSLASTDLVFLEPNTFVPLLTKIDEGYILKLVESSNGFFSSIKFLEKTTLLKFPNLVFSGSAVKALFLT